MDSPWFRGSAELLTYAIEELLATKVRALYQRSKGRDLYDLAASLERFPGMDKARLVECFERYMEHEGHRVSRAEFEANMDAKMRDPEFNGDIGPLLAGVTYDPVAAYCEVHTSLVARLHGEQWKGAE